MKTSATPLILASGSPRRRELLAAMGLDFQVQPSQDDEQVPDGTPPVEMVELLAFRKAASVAVEHEAGLVIGSDTIVVIDGDILGKPRDDKEAVRMLDRLQGRTHQVYTGLAVMKASGGSLRSMELEDVGLPIASYGETCQYRFGTVSGDGKPEVIVGHSVSQVTFRAMSREEIEAYVKTGEPRDKAGAYGVQGLGAVFIDRIEGDFYCVMGLPVNLVYPVLLQFGVNPFAAREGTRNLT